MTIDHQAIRDQQAGPRLTMPEENLAAFGRIRDNRTPPTPTMSPLQRRRTERAARWIIQDKSWHSHGACVGLNPDIWFPEKGNTVAAETAKEICLTCPVKDDCLADAMIRNEEFGIWGGVSARGREQLKRDGRTKPIYGCGTSVGFKDHVQRGQTPCSACRRAEKTRLRSAEYSKEGR